MPPSMASSPQCELNFCLFKQIVCIVIYTQTVPGSYRAMRGEPVGHQETTRTVPMGTLEQIPAQREIDAAGLTNRVISAKL